MRARLTGLFCLAVLGISLLAILPGQVGAGASRSGAIDPRLFSQSVSPGDWPMYGHDASRTSFNPDETTISAGNVGQLVQRWQANIGFGSQAPFNAPSVANGKVYVGSSIASGDNFFAFDAVTGGEAWHKNLGYDSSCFLRVGIGNTAAISGTLVVVGGGDLAYYGLDANNGDQIWRDTVDAGPAAFAWASPLMANGRAYYGVAAHCFNTTVRGEVRSVDMLTGGQRVSQFMVPEGAVGGSIWNSPALSPDGNILAVATGNDQSCGSNCQYTRSVVAMDADTLGILGWNQQGTAGTDQDFTSTPNFFSDNQGRVLVGAQHKGGNFYAYLASNVSAGPIWSKANGGPVGMLHAYDPTLGDGGTLFLGGSGGRIYAVDPATGTDRWPGGITTGATLAGNMAIANRLIFINGATAGLQIRSEIDGSLLRTIVPPGVGSVASGPAVAHGMVYWQSGSFINAWGLEGTPQPTATPTNTGTPTPTSPATATATAGCNTQTLDVLIQSFQFVSGTLTVTLGSTVRWTNRDKVAHTSTSKGGVWDSGPLAANQSFEFTFNQVGTYPYICTPHPFMTGTITVVLGCLPTPTSTSAATSTNTPANTATTTPTAQGLTPTATNTSVGTATNTAVASTPTATPAVTSTATPPVGTPTPCAIAFTDVSPTDYFYEPVRYLFCVGAISGYADGTFRPYNNTTRGQLTKIVVVAEGWPIDTSGGPHFQDVPESNPFYGYIETAYNHGIISGYGCGTDCLEFRWGSNVTRGQLCKIVVLAEGWTIDTSGGPHFQDVPTTDPFYEVIETAYNHGIISGYGDGTFRPGNNATRGQIAKIVYNALSGQR